MVQRTGFHGTLGQSSAQVIDGSLQFDQSRNTHLTRTPGSAGNRRTWTWSGWCKRQDLGNFRRLFEAGSNTSNFTTITWQGDNDSFELMSRTSGTNKFRVKTTRLFRDLSAWYHVVVSMNIPLATQTDRCKIYINGERITDFDDNTQTDSDTDETFINSTNGHFVGTAQNVSASLEGLLSQVYLIDGQELDPDSFGFTDPLTNTWRPKKYEGTFGTNGFYLPFDGNFPVGQDKSGSGNNYTAVNFGGFTTLDKATGGLPILNTVGGGNIASASVRTDVNATAIVMAIPFLGSSDDISSRVRGSGSNLTVTTSGSPAPDSDPYQWYGSSFNVSTSNYIDEIGSTSTFAFLHQPEAAGTIEGWINVNAINNQGPWFQTSNGTNEIGIMIRQNSSTNVFVQINRGVSGQAINISGDVTIAFGRWYHWALVKSASGFAQFFLNGQPVADKVAISTDAGASNAASTSSTSQHEGRIGKNNGEARGVGANICDYRAYTVQKYAFDTPFIPASIDPDIVPDSPSGVSGGSNLAKSVSGGVAFDGSNDSIEFTDNGDMNPGSGDFTLEGFINTLNTSDERHYPIIQKGNTASNNNYDWRMYFNDTANSNTHLWFDAECGGSDVNMGANGDDELTIGNWYHFAVTRSSGTFRLFLNGVLQDTDSSTTNAIDNDHTGVEIGFNDLGAAGDTFLQGFISNLRFIKGTALYTANFTPPTEPLTAVTNTKLLCCQSTTSATAAAVTPASITNNGSTQATTFNPFNTDINTVRGQESNYPTWNPLNNKFLNASGGTCTLTNSNLTVQGNSSVSGSNVSGTIGASSGKFYIEYTIVTGADSNDTAGFGIRKLLAEGTFNGWNQEYFRGTRMRSSDNGYYPDATGESFSTLSVAGDVVGIAFDIEGNFCQITLNNRIISSSSSAGLSGSTWFPYFASDGGGKVTINCGQKPFKFTPPDGYRALNNAAVRPEKVIARPDRYVGAITYQGITQSPRTISLPITPDLIWVKNRDDTNGHYLFDTVRGDNKNLRSDGTFTESAVSGASHGIISTIGSNSFTVKDGSSTGDNVGSTTTEDYVAWFWKAGGNKGTFNKDDVGYVSASAAGLTAGDSSEVTGSSVGTKQGFSIIKYEANGSNGATVPHGLNQPVDLILFKSLGRNDNWRVYHSAVGHEKCLFLSTNGTPDDNASYFNDTAPTSSVFSLGTDTGVNTDDDDVIAYCWHDVPGLQKFGSFTGNNSTNGAFIELGFRPALVWIKRTGSTGHWFIIDNKRRYTFNPVDEYAFTDIGNVYDPTNGGPSGGIADFLSNGIKLRENNAGANESDSYIYCAWAEAPSFNLYGGQSNAR